MIEKSTGGPPGGLGGLHRHYFKDFVRKDGGDDVTHICSPEKT